MSELSPRQVFRVVEAPPPLRLESVSGPVPAMQTAQAHRSNVLWTGTDASIHHVEIHTRVAGEIDGVFAVGSLPPSVAVTTPGLCCQGEACLLTQVAGVSHLLYVQPSKDGRDLSTCMGTLQSTSPGGASRSQWQWQGNHLGEQFRRFFVLPEQLRWRAVTLRREDGANAHECTVWLYACFVAGDRLQGSGIVAARCVCTLVTQGAATKWDLRIQSATSTARQPTDNRNVCQARVGASSGQLVVLVGGWGHGKYGASVSSHVLVLVDTNALAAGRWVEQSALQAAGVPGYENVRLNQCDNLCVDQAGRIFVLQHAPEPMVLCVCPQIRALFALAPPKLGGARRPCLPKALAVVNGDVLLVAWSVSDSGDGDCTGLSAKKLV